MIRRSGILLTLCVLFLAGPLSAGSLPRPGAWATAIPSERLDNFYRIDPLLYRSAQPDAAAMNELEALGIRRILNLRQFHSDDDEAKGTSLRLHRVPMNAGSITEEEVVSALKLIGSSKDPVLVHCWHGSDRTGTVVAMYRLVFQGWSREAALDELVNGGYGYHAIYGNIPEFIDKADIEGIRKQVLGD